MVQQHQRPYPIWPTILLSRFFQIAAGSPFIEHNDTAGCTLHRLVDEYGRSPITCLKRLARNNNLITLVWRSVYATCGWLVVIWLLVIYPTHIYRSQFVMQRAERLWWVNWARSPRLSMGANTPPSTLWLNFRAQRKGEGVDEREA